MSGELEAALLRELALSPGFVSGEKLARALRVSCLLYTSPSPRDS